MGVGQSCVHMRQQCAVRFMSMLHGASCVPHVAVLYCCNFVLLHVSAVQRPRTGLFAPPLRSGTWLACLFVQPSPTDGGFVVTAPKGS